MKNSGGYNPDWPSPTELYPDAVEPGVNPLFPENVSVIKTDILPETYMNWFRKIPPVYVFPIHGKEDELTKYLKAQNINYTSIDSVFSMPYSPAIQAAVDQGLGRIQDIGSFYTIKNLPVPEDAEIWDCCSGAGGKSIALTETYQNIKLYCSDKRSSVTSNLAERFRIAGLKPPATAVYDILSNNPAPWNRKFDVIICDAPCSGSGTWRHTPEELHFFSPDKVNTLSELQSEIMNNCWSFLKPGGLLVYITCSIFTAENELVINSFCENNPSELIEAAQIGGAEMNADYFFRALIKKPYLAS